MMKRKIGNHLRRLGIFLALMLWVAPFFSLFGQGGESVGIISYPTSVYPEGKFDVSVSYNASVNREILINLVDPIRNVWHGSVRKRVSAGQGTTTLSLAVIDNPPPREGYIFLRIQMRSSVVIIERFQYWQTQVHFKSRCL
jgi:hypothetical protein